MNSDVDTLRDSDATAPRRVLILSAEMGEGHNAAARALTEVMEEEWPGCQIERLDTFKVAGERLAQGARWAYGYQLTKLPWTYQVFYDALSRHDGLARGLKAVLGGFFGRRLSSAVLSRDVDLIISTYPFGSAALEWMITERNLTTPTATYIPAFHVHPLWAYERIDRHFVMYDTAPGHARTAGFGASMRLGAPPVRKGFGDVNRADARAGLGLPADGFVVLITGGAWGLGHLGDGVRALLGIDAPITVLAVCGKNARLAAELRGLGSARLTVLDYVDNMPELMAAANVVVTNGAGVTVLEMIRRNLALRADDVEALADAISRLATDETLLHRMERAAETWRGDRELRQSVEELRLVATGAGVPALPA
jgi:UDP-N-acetylglucosamine:LPS N-acetylglucosamine transferase